jgi:outer membrane protein assembly factor BamB
VNGIIYVGSRDANLYAIDANTGIKKWSYSTNGISLEQSSPTVAHGVGYIGGWYDVPAFSRKGSLYAVDAGTGQLVWEKLQNTGISSSPTVANGRLYVTTDDLNLYALDVVSGNILWSKQILANSASAAVCNGVVYVGGGGSRYFYAFDAANGSEKWRFAVPQGLMTSSPLIVTSNNDAGYSGDSGVMN